MNLFSCALILGALTPAPSFIVSGEPAKPTWEAADQAKEAPGATLQIRIRGHRNQNGKLAVALFDRESAFPEQDKAARGIVVRLGKADRLISFKGLKPARYAVAVLHDENSNGKMDFNFLGMPTEGFGFSNDASAPFGPPSFEEAAVRVGKTDKRISIKLRYFL